MADLKQICKADFAYGSICRDFVDLVLGDSARFDSV
jgi:hypothetical protein